MKNKSFRGETRPLVLRREDSLSSHMHRGVCVRVLYERAGFEVVRTEMEPGTVLDEGDIIERAGVHFVLDGGPVFHVARQAADLMPGDSIALQAGEPCTVSNPTSATSSILSFLFKKSDGAANDK